MVGVVSLDREEEKQEMCILTFYSKSKVTELLATNNFGQPSPECRPQVRPADT